MSEDILKHQLINRLYDKGISYGTMPSVQRPKTENMRPYTAVLPSSRQQKRAYSPHTAAGAYGRTQPNFNPATATLPHPMNQFFSGGEFKDITQDIQPSTEFGGAPTDPLQGIQETQHKRIKSSSYKGLPKVNEQTGPRSAQKAYKYVRYTDYDKEKFAKPRTSLLGGTHPIFKDPSKKSLKASGSVRSITGVSTMTALGPSKHLRARKDARQSKRKTVHHMIKTESMAPRLLELIKGEEELHPEEEKDANFMKCYTMEEYVRSEAMMKRLRGKQEEPPGPRMGAHVHNIQHIRDQTQYEIEEEDIIQEERLEESPRASTRIEMSKSGVVGGGSTLIAGTQMPKGEKSTQKKEKGKVGIARWTELDKWIKMQQNMVIDQGEFIHVKQKPKSHPYDLDKVDFKDVKDSYATLSKKGITYYIGSEPVEFVNLSDWLIERDLFLQVSQLSFFKRFRRWKTLKNWRRNVVRCKREHSKKILEERLFHADEVMGGVLRQHRLECYEMQRLKLFDLSGQMDIQDLGKFQDTQKKKQKLIIGMIEGYSKKCRENFADGIERQMKKIKEKIKEEAMKEDNMQKNKKQGRPNTQGGMHAGPSTQESRKPLNVDQVYQKLGFSYKLSYSDRSILRKNCSRFLRFSYLIDFITMDSLRNIYLTSMTELNNHIQHLNYIPIPTSLETAKKPTTGATSSRYKDVHESLLLVNVAIELRPITEREIKKREIPKLQEYMVMNKEVLQEFQFDPSCHLTFDDEEMSGDLCVQYYVENLCSKWLKVSPNSIDVQNLFITITTQALNTLKHYERWSKHEDLTNYANALEEWDDKVVEEWEAIDDTSLDLEHEEWLRWDEIYNQKENKIIELVEVAFEKTNNYLTYLEPYLHIYWKNQQIRFHKLGNEKLRMPIDVISMTMDTFIEQKSRFNRFLPENVDLGLFRVDVSSIRKELLDTPKECISRVEETLPPYLHRQCHDVKDWILNWTKEISDEVDSVERFVAQAKAIKYVKDTIQEIQEKIELYGNLYLVCNEYKLEVPKDQSEKEILALIRQLNSAVYDAEDAAMRTREHFISDLNLQINTLFKDVDQFIEDVQDRQFLDINSSLPEMLNLANELKARYVDIESRAEKYNDSQDALDLAYTTFEKVDDARIMIELRRSLWEALHEWSELVTTWVSTPFVSIDTKLITGKADYYTRIVTRCQNELPKGSTSVQELKNMVTEFKETMPVVLALGNINFKPDHWKEIKDLLNVDFEMEKKEFTLGELIGLNAVHHQEEIIYISTVASHEAMLKAELAEIVNKWIKGTLYWKKYSELKEDRIVLTGLDDLFLELDDTLTKLNNILGSRFVKRLLEDAEEIKNKFDILQETMEEWKMCQRNWIYLENIFSSSDMKKSLQKEFLSFDAVDRTWKKIMEQVKKRPLVSHYWSSRHVWKQLNDCNNNMADIQRKIENHLEEKRQEFPRFYFLSNDELLQILSHSNDILALQHHLSKLFTNVFRLQLDTSDPEGPPPSEIQGLISLEGEVLPLFHQIRLKAEGVVFYLKKIEERMMEAIQREMKSANSETIRPNYERKSWILKHPGQIVMTVSQIVWTEGTEMSIEDLGDNSRALIDMYEDCENNLNLLTVFIKEDLSPITREIVVNLVKADVHNRDIVESLIWGDVLTTRDFLWQQQLKFYMDDHEGGNTVKIRQINSVLIYGFEYIGATSRLVITPLTDRCWITITGALHIHLGASPAGPAGTGKTESVKDLAKALGIQCVVFNCSDQIDNLMMERLFCGLVQQGSWSCLDEFNRIEIEVLSVIAQQLLQIRIALMKGETEFEFSGDPKRKIKPSCGVFVTMNPGYTGRTELPDNLKVLFRPVSMMIPNYELIAEIMLFSEGFFTSKILSKKMVQLYKLASEQLSQEKHYDFGMRAVKSVLVMAGALKRADPTSNEDILLIRAVRDSNLPKFLSYDIPLFQALIQDLFPEIIIPEVDYGILEKQIISSIKSKQLIDNEVFIYKVIQLFDIFNVRFGVMLVGPTGGGKTKCYEILKDALTELSKSNKNAEGEDIDKRYQTVTTKVLNPKSVSLGELFGEENENTCEWTYGLAANLMKKGAKQTGDDYYWQVFDGPVDTKWIENMNTVLDDNMTLCLANGERIGLRSQMRMLFEVQDLAVASPATVSRCGMVYMTQSDLGWKPIFQSWMLKQFPDQEVLELKAQEYLTELFDHTIDSGLRHLHQLKEYQVMPLSEIQAVISLCNFLGYFITKQFYFKSTEPLEPIKFDDLVRGLFSKVQIPMAETTYQYFCEISGTENKFVKMVHWNTLVPEFEYSKNTPFFSLMVPTIDTVRYSKLLQICIEMSKPAFFTGETGVGKSVMIQNLILSKKDDLEFMPVLVNFSAQTSSAATQMSIEGKLVKKKGRKILGAPGQNKCLVFIDDVNMPIQEESGAQPPIELLRQLLDFGGFYNRPFPSEGGKAPKLAGAKFFWKEIKNTMLICAAAPSGGGRSVLTPRFMRHFHLFSLPRPDEEALRTIFEGILLGFLNEYNFQDQVRKLGTIAVSSTIEVYTRIEKLLLPTPAKFHYTFNLRDVSKVFQGILMCSPKSVNNADTFTRLWVHEVCRVFGDRLVCEMDRWPLYKAIIELLGAKFSVRWEYDDVFSTKRIIFSNILKLDHPVQLYEEILYPAKIAKVCEDMLFDYNLTSPSKMALVFFSDAIEHITRIGRVLSQPRGSMLIMGVGGCGKQSLTTLSSFMLGVKYCQVKPASGKKDAIRGFKEQVKDVMNIAGLDGKPVAFVMTDSQIASESFLEDVNNLLNTGEIPNLFDQEDTDKIMGDIAPIVAKLGRIESRDVKMATYIERVRDQLHIMLCMSPVGDTLRIRCRKFPSLVNCCTLDYFDRWPQEALNSVGKKVLSELAFLSKEKQHKLSELFPFVHMTVAQEAENFWAQLRRRVYITPKSFLDALNLFSESLQDQIRTHRDDLGILINGLSKLRKTEQQVGDLKDILTQLQPELKEQKRQANEALERNKEESQKAGVKEKLVARETQIVDQQALEIKITRDEAERELAEVEPILKQATEGVKNISAKDLTIVKGYPHPHHSVELTLQAVLTILGEKNTDWDNAKSVMASMEFKKRLERVDMDNINHTIIIKLNGILAKEEFDVEEIGRKSLPCKSLAAWCVAVSKYSAALKKVRPKRKKLEEIQGKYDFALSELKLKKDELEAMKSILAQYQIEFNQMVENAEKLENEIENTKTKLVNAEKLIFLLSDEGVRWHERAEEMKLEEPEILGNVFLSAGFISYVGPFTGPFRDNLLVTFMAEARDKEMKTSDNYKFVNNMGSPLEIKNWNLAGLPTDSVSIDNGVLATRTKRWPLMIDPQGQANKWVKNMEKDKFLHILKMNTPSDQFAKILDQCIMQGHCLLIEDVGEEMDPTLDPVLGKKIFKQHNITQIHRGDRDIPYDANFKLYLTTKLSNPLYMPEVSILVTIINFTVTFEGLEEQLLGDVIHHEQPKLEEERTKLIYSIANYHMSLKEIADKILQLLADASEETILVNYELINTLEGSKLKSIQIHQMMSKSKESETKVNITRNQYRSISFRGSILYFCIADLGGIDPMYQYSLDYVKKLFKKAMSDTPPTDDFQNRLESLLDHITKNIYRNICRGLFEKDKLTFSFLICSSIQRKSGMVGNDAWNYLLRGPGLVSEQEIEEGEEGGPTMLENPLPKFISREAWDLVAALENSMFPKFGGLGRHITDNIPIWTDFATTAEPHKFTLPGNYQEKLTRFDKLLLLRIFRPEKLLFGCTYYVQKELGQFFIESPSVSMEAVFQDSDKITPIIFVLSSGADPTGQLFKFAEEKGMQDKLTYISLGKGQEKKAGDLIEMGKYHGNWVLLQNCHLAKSFMSQLETYVMSFEETKMKIQDSFRLFLTSMPATYFPVPVLQNGLKSTTEPPRGVKANVKRTFAEMTEATYDSCPSKQKEFHKLLLGLSFFHAIVQERRKFGALGWNIRYEFNDSDLETSMTMLQIFLEEQEEIPWEAMNYVAGNINYGGRVTDDWDRLLLLNILKKFYTTEILAGKEYKFSMSDKYLIKEFRTLGSVREYIEQLPSEDDPCLFGMHENANITYQSQESDKLLQTILHIQPKVQTTEGQSSDEIVLQLLKDLSHRHPNQLEKDQGRKSIVVTLSTAVIDCHTTVLMQEIERYNKLLHLMRGSFLALERAINGYSLMSNQLDQMYLAMLRNLVPPNWQKVSYESLMPLGSWFRDMLKRVEFMRAWLNEGHPNCFWISGFFFPQGFLTGTLQKHARKYKIPIDQLSFSFSVLKKRDPHKIKDPPKDGIYIFGLHMEAADWDMQNQALIDQKPGGRYLNMPIIKFIPKENYEKDPTHYSCPVYQTLIRAGVLSTTGYSTNFILAVDLPTHPDDSPEKWTLRGTAMACQLTH